MATKPDSSMKIIFLIQGEGNGHLTQAVSLYQMLSVRGHEVLAVMIGSGTGERNPDFFRQSIGCPVLTYKSISLSYSKSGRLKAGTTLRSAANTIPALSNSLRSIHSVVSLYQPDLIVNFYEICGGLYKALYKTSIPMVCIGHQYLFQHEDFQFPRKKIFHRLGLRILNALTALKAEHKYALSFSEKYESTSKMTVVPPLLRQQLKKCSPSDRNYLLVYLTQPLLRPRIEDWHRRNPDVVLHCFCNHPLQTETEQVSETLFFHPNGSTHFLSLLEHCRALLTTSGFESVCEAVYLGKPVMMVPVPNHYEQECNALDAGLNRVGIVGKSFDPDLLFECLSKQQHPPEELRKWFEKTEHLLPASLESVAGSVQREMAIGKNRALSAHHQMVRTPDRKVNSINL